MLLSIGADNNPYERGCLLEKQVKGALLRICNSQVDDEATIAQGKCRQPYFNHLEIRILSQNWETVFFETWLLQIILSELLDIPTTVETGTTNASLNFYDARAHFEYGTAGNDVTALVNAAQAKGSDCRNVVNDDSSSRPYVPCAHVVPETWVAASQAVKDAVKAGFLEVPQTLGMVGNEGWYVNKLTAVQDATLDSYIGLQGEENRRKLAETFLRPTTWKDYCTEVSNTNCTVPDTIATRAPLSIEEEGRFFVQGKYMGHFRATAKNDCNATVNCTGFVADYPCGWNSYVEAQAFHLNIALESEGEEPGSRGYTYEQLLDIWNAANFTNSPVIGMWWNLSPQYSKYLGTDSEYHIVTFPPTTQACIDARISTSSDRCSPEKQDRVGDPEGVCGESPNALNKLIVGTLREATRGPQIPRAERSAAYDVLSSFTISEFQIFEIFQYWESEPTPRDALCRWASENMDYLNSFIPTSYPRVLQTENQKSVLFYFCTILGVFTVVLVITVSVFVHRRRKKRAIQYAQITFLRLLLAGSFLIGIGAILAGIPPTDASCLSKIWFVNVGYTLQIVPLIVKVAAIAKMMSAAQRMRRTNIRKHHLLLCVAIIMGVLVIFLILWSVLDPPRKEGEYRLSSSPVENGSTIIDATYYCSSESEVWGFIGVGWDVLLLLVASVLAIQTRNIRQDFNESRTLAFLIYSHFVFVLLRLATYFLEDSGVLNSTLQGVRSLLYSTDTIAGIW